MLEVEAVVLGYTKRDCWLSIPGYGAVHHPVILTMPRNFLVYGTATAERVLLRYDPSSLHHDGHGFVVEGEITGKVE